MDERGPNSVYALGHNPGESARLQRQADELAPESTVVLERTGLALGQSALDLGCGPRGVLDLLAAPPAGFEPATRRLEDVGTESAGVHRCRLGHLDQGFHRARDQ